MPRYRKGDLPQGGTDWERLNSDRVGESGAPDAENPLWTRAAFAEADLVTPGGLTRAPVYIRMYKVVLDYYRSFGKGYQTRINDDLLELVRRRQSRANRAEPVTRRPVSVVAGSRWQEGRATIPRAS